MGPACNEDGLWGEVEADHSGEACPTELERQEPCNTLPCPVDCELSEFTEGAACSLSCGGGTQLFTRHILTAPANGGASCDQAPQPTDHVLTVSIETERA